MHSLLFSLSFLFYLPRGSLAAACVIRRVRERRTPRDWFARACGMHVPRPRDGRLVGCSGYISPGAGGHSLHRGDDVSPRRYLRHRNPSRVHPVRLRYLN